MELPEHLQQAIDAILQQAKPTGLREARLALSQEYREGDFHRSIFENEGMRLAYLATRFSATYAASVRVLSEIPSHFPDWHPSGMIDLGAGPGTASWAGFDVFETLAKSIALEKSGDAILLGEEIAKAYPKSHVGWQKIDLESGALSLPRADLCVASYSFGELKRPREFLERIWDAPLSVYVWIEPGTPRGYQNILLARDFLIQRGAHLLAPCPHAFGCPLKGNDWCHFAVRLSRTRLHRILKEGSLGYEDEKFSYLIASKIPFSSPPFSRILRRPQKGSGHVRLTLCQHDGTEANCIISKKQKELYRVARDSDWGEIIVSN